MRIKSQIKSRAQKTNRPYLKVYCPACGKWGNHPLVDLSPGGEVEWTCDACKTIFVIHIDYEVVEEGKDEEELESAPGD